MQLNLTFKIMKNLLYLCAIVLFTACGSDDPVAVDPIVETTNGITTLDATGTVSCGDDIILCVWILVCLSSYKSK